MGYSPIRILMAVCLLAFVSGCEDCGSEDPWDGGTDDSGLICSHDGYNSPATAGDLEPGAVENEWVTSGYICPVGDLDWYNLTIPDGHHILQVILDVTGPMSSVQPMYVVYECEAGCDDISECCTARAAPRSGELTPNQPLSITHCLGAGDYYIMVRDMGDDSQDPRSPRGEYHLTVSTSENTDPSEPNDTSETASALDSAGANTWSTTGTISCRGDQDWYALDSRSGITINASDIVQVQLTSPVANYQPQFRIIDAEGTVEATETNESDDATDLSVSRTLDSAGPYFVVIEDDDGNEADPNATYELTVSLLDNIDPYEPNDDPIETSDLGSLACTGSWATLTANGATISTGDDIDIYPVNLDPNCRGGILEATVAFSAGVPENLSPSVRVVRTHPASTCATGNDCNVLLGTDCDADDLDGIDCSGIGNECTMEGVCRGGSICLPGGQCGANIIERHPDYCQGTYCHDPRGTDSNRSCTTSEDCAPQHRISTAVPLGRNPDLTETALTKVWVIVSDFQGNGSSPTLTYDLTVRTRTDPDGNEPNEYFNPLLNDESRLASDDTGVTLNWTTMCATGALSYERDIDVFRLPYPCTNPSGCRASVNYTISSGPVEVSAYDPNGWRDVTELGEEDVSNNPSRNGTYGNSECLPLNSSFDGGFTIIVRDRFYNRDFSADQSYEICFRVQSPTCTAPCVDDGKNCWYE